MKVKHLESAISAAVETPQFPNPNVSLEQYVTSPTLTAHILHYALERHKDVGPGISVLDLGCGTGMLTMGCILVECDFIIAVDCDERALSVAKSNVRSINDHEEDRARVEFILAKVRHPLIDKGGTRHRQGRRHGPITRRTRAGRGRPFARSCHGETGPNAKRDISSHEEESSSVAQGEGDGVPLTSKCVDTVLTNPPFGTKNSGMDIAFLRAATRLARRAVYSFHKTCTRDHVVNQIIRKELHLMGTVVAEMRFDIPSTYHFHTKPTVDIAVDLIRTTFPPIP